MIKEESLVGYAYNEMIATKKYNLMIIAGLSLVVLIQTVALLFKSTEYVITPPSYTQELRISEGEGNKEYQQQFALSIALLVGNVDQRNVDFVTDEVLKMMSPHLRAQVAENLKREAQVLKIRKATQSFVVEDMMYSAKNNVVWVWGKKTLSNKSGDKDVRRFTYEFRIQPVDGRPRITYFSAYDGQPKQKDSKYVVPVNPYMTEEQEAILETTIPENSTLPVYERQSITTAEVEEPIQTQDTEVVQ